MLSFGRPSKALHDFKQELQRMDDAIKHAENERGKYRADYIRQRMKAIDERLGELKDKLKPYQAKAEKARRSLEAAEKALQDANNATHYENNKLINEKHRLQHELNELEPEPLESEHDAAEWLKLLRQGKIKTIVGGQDPNLDKAYSQYTREKTLIKDWARRNKVARTTEGDELPPPDCLKEWPHNRVREITGAAGS